VTKALVLLIALALVAGAATLWRVGSHAQPVTVDEIGDENQTVPRGQLPLFAAKDDAAQLYTFAVANVDTLRWMPCMCGCARSGHSSNRSCYVKSESNDLVTFTSHAAT